MSQWGHLTLSGGAWRFFACTQHYLWTKITFLAVLPGGVLQTPLSRNPSRSHKENDSRICGIKETWKAYGLAFFIPISYQWNCRIVKTWCQFWCGPVHSVEQLYACLWPRSLSFCPRMPWGTTTELSILDNSGSVLCNYSYFPKIYKQVSL